MANKRDCEKEKEHDKNKIKIKIKYLLEYSCVCKL